MKDRLTIIILFIIVLLGLFFRLQGIKDNHSFWSDEAYISSLGRDIDNGKPFIQTLQRSGYQPLQVLSDAFVYKLLGYTEFSGRILSVIFGTVGIIFAFLIGWKLSNPYGGFLSAFLYAFSQLNLANSTQSKQYAILEALLLLIIYLLFRLPEIKNKTISKSSLRSVICLSIGAVLFSCIAGLYHLIGASFLLICGIYFVIKYFKVIKKIPYKPLIISSFLLIVYLTLYVTKGISFFEYLISLHNGKFLFFFNNSVYLKNLLLRQYGVFFIPAVIAILMLIKKQRAFVFSVVIWILFLLFVWNFQYYSHNLRYLVPLFGIVFVLFGIFWGKAGEWMAKKTKITYFVYLPILIIVLLYISGYKIVRKPLAYYSPNADFYGDVQVADYKDMYSLIRKEIPDYQHIAIFNDVIDAQRWYMPEKKIDAYFMKGITKPQKHPVEGGMIYGTLADFLKEQAKYPKGIIIVEDWQSFLPDDIKEYVKTHLKLQIKVTSLPDAPNDPWPLEVYSWGI